MKKQRNAEEFELCESEEEWNWKGGQRSEEGGREGDELRRQPGGI